MNFDYLLKNFTIDYLLKKLNYKILSYFRIIKNKKDFFEL